MKRSVALACLLLAAPCVHADEPVIAVVLHPSNPLTALSQNDVMRLYLGKTRVFPDQSPARPVYLSNGVSPRREFDSRVLNKNQNQVKAYWAQQIFTGRGTPPREVDSADALRAFVANHPDAIGFLVDSEVDGSVRTVLRID